MITAFLFPTESLNSLARLAAWYLERDCLLLDCLKCFIGAELLFSVFLGDLFTSMSCNSSHSSPSLLTASHGKGMHELMCLQGSWMKFTNWHIKVQSILSKDLSTAYYESADLIRVYEAYNLAGFVTWLHFQTEETEEKNKEECTSSLR